MAKEGIYCLHVHIRINMLNQWHLHFQCHIPDWSTADDRWWLHFYPFFKTFFICTSFIYCGKFGSLYSGKAIAATKAATLTAASACCTSVSTHLDTSIWKYKYACSCWCMRLHPGTVWTPSKSLHWYTDCGRKMPCRIKKSNLHQHYVWLFCPTLYWVTMHPMCPNSYECKPHSLLLFLVSRQALQNSLGILPTCACIKCSWTHTRKHQEISSWTHNHTRRRENLKMHPLWNPGQFNMRCLNCTHLFSTLYVCINWKQSPPQK